MNIEGKNEKEVEEMVLSVMNKFSADSVLQSDINNFQKLVSMQRELMKRVSQMEFQKPVPNFLRNFLEEFDNIYVEGLPEAIIVALKTGKRINLTKDWWKQKKEII